MLRLGRLLRHQAPAASRSLATPSASSSSTSKRAIPPQLGKKGTPKSSALSLKPRDAEAEKKPHVPKQSKHGRLTRKARPPTPPKWIKPKPREPTARTRNRARLRRRTRATLLASPQARLRRIRLGFHTLRSSRALRRGRRGRLPAWLRTRLAERGELQSRRNRKRRGRPQISLDRPKRWNRPLREGILPAYDEALRVIRADAWRVRKEAKEQKREVQRTHDRLVAKTEDGAWVVQGEERTLLEAELEKKRQKLRILDVQSEVNLPEVRWSVSNAMADLSIPSHRHLVEQRWRKDGDLDLLMERIHQMNVVPDVLPVLHPSIDLHVAARLMPVHFDDLMQRNRFQRRLNTFKDVVPGNYLTPRQTRVPPKLYANVFHTDVRLYTMLLVDPDVPDESTQSFTTFLHWLKPNIPLSATHKGRIPFLNTHTRYIPPHPQRGTPYHRYVLLLLPQPPQAGHRYNLNTEALLTEQQARLSQSLQDRAKSGVDVEARVAEAEALKRGRNPRHKPRPTHPNAGLPHPQSGEDPLAEVVTLSQRVGIPVIPDEERLGFNVRQFVKQWGLNGAMGGGVHMWREVWDKYVGAVYRYELHQPQPMYGRPPRSDPQREAHSAPTPRKYRLDA
ncbi:hypothetical protein FB45DRAFT_832913 [Roridomyces roridus]|uniref:PEBP-like protein n=1 Tax=Roridomyces roridus TaxID=1738132 RepID=A0AAD7FNC2_9AGAR|nr:hypothetical protein FB45DRAFT_832913 [Roridomyces roridus]